MINGKLLSIAVSGVSLLNLISFKLVNPKTFNWLLMLNKAKNKTKAPAIFKNFADCCGLSKNFADVNPIKRSMGAVPRAKNSIISPPWIGLAERRAALWAVKVNPQGRKKVKIPEISGICFLFKFFPLAMRRVMNPPHNLIMWGMNFGIVIWNFRKALIPNISKARKIIIKEIAKIRDDDRDKEI